MAYKYGHRDTSLNWIWIYLQKNYPNSEVIRLTKKDVPRHIRDLKPINDLMINFLKEIKENYTKSIQFNSKQTQKKFNKFIIYCNKNLKKQNHERQNIHYRIDSSSRNPYNRNMLCNGINQVQP